MAKKQSKSPRLINAIASSLVNYDDTHLLDIAYEATDFYNMEDEPAENVFFG